jgi:tRNA nucleotidyltransferase (CCA-adding enzyme)
MDVITTHLNADFDAFGSMVAAKKLYPDAVLSFPGSQEKSVRDFFMESTLYLLAIERAKDMDIDSIDRLILVDTRQKSRIGVFGAVVDAGRAEIHVYDHHPDSDDDVRGALEVVRRTGSTVTILLDEIRKRGIELNAEEATVLALGIYEDTGSFTFNSTTPEDMEAASYLLRRGANLNIISDMMTGDLTRDQVEVLHQLIEEAETVDVGGLEITVTVAGVVNYVPDVALMVHKYRDIESVNAVFALIRMDGRVHLVARSRLEEVNAAEIAAEFGGGGHPTAASAVIRDMGLYEAKEKLVAALHEKARPKADACGVMSRPVITIEPDKTALEASETLLRYQVSSLPVVQSEGRVVGIVHRHSVEKALHHGLGGLSVKDLMDPNFESVGLHDPIDKVTKISVQAGRRLVPVMDSGNLVGVISRSDLLEHMRLPRTKDADGPDRFPQGRGRVKMAQRLMEEHFPERVLNILRLSGVVAGDMGVQAYLVGGAVRDMLLRNHNLDIDLVVEGEGIPFARRLAETVPGCRVRPHEKFGTAVLLFEDGFKIDVATARHEYYASPGALPTVEMSSIKRDLYRRDFTVNTLAISLHRQTFGKVMDFFGGVRDIKDKIIRVLHNLAFVEDPTRILRAVRFSTRFSFTVDKHTLSLLKRAVKIGVFDKVEGMRLKNELIHILDEKNPLRPLQLAADLGILRAVHPALAMPPQALALVESCVETLAWWKYLFADDKLQPWLVHFLALTDHASDEDFQETASRFSIPPSTRNALTKARAVAKTALMSLGRGDAKPSEITRALDALPMETLLFMMAKTGRDHARRAISDYIVKFRYIRPSLTGADLIAMGYEPGRRLGAALAALKEAKLDGVVKNPDEERALAEKLQAAGDEGGRRPEGE